MKIVYLSQSFVPSKAANSVHVMNMAAAFSELGHTVALSVASRQLFAKSAQRDFETYGFESNLFALKKSWFPKLGTAGRLIFSILAAFDCINSKVDLLYSRHPMGLFVASKLFTIPYALELHSPPAGIFEKKIIERLIAGKGFRGLVVISDALKRIILKVFPSLSCRQVIVAHDGAKELGPVNGREFQIAGAKNCINAGYAGHLYTGRGIEVILNVAERLPHVNFHIVGGLQNDIERCKATVRSGNVHFYGHKDPAEIPYFLSRMDILLAPYQLKVAVSGGGGNSVDWMSPLKIFEYMAAGKTLVASDLPVLREVLRDKENSILVKCDDIEAWVKQIKTLAADDKLRIRLGESARRDFLNNYTWKARASDLIKALMIKD